MKATKITKKETVSTLMPSPCYWRQKPKERIVGMAEYMALYNDHILPNRKIIIHTEAK